MLDLRDSVHLSLGVPKNTLIAILLHYSLFHRTPPGTCIPYELFTASCCTPLFKLDCLPTLFSASIIYLIIAIFFRYCLHSIVAVITKTCCGVKLGRLFTRAFLLGEIVYQGIHFRPAQERTCGHQCVLGQTLLAF